ncbi:hypothetical protein BGZ51_006478 [Haplosporangium sp. Z 767]|nr:hypothetical protein BGZ51_006478 [Haplosporangium sp. Z 767]
MPKTKPITTRLKVMNSTTTKALATEPKAKGKHSITTVATATMTTTSTSSTSTKPPSKKRPVTKVKRKKNLASFSVLSITGDISKKIRRTIPLGLKAEFIKGVIAE